MPDVNTISDYATICLNLALVIVTILTVKEMREGRRLSLIPLLTFHVEIIPENGPEFPGRSNKVVIQNIGNGPALKTTVALKLINPETSITLIEPVEWSLGILGINQQLTKELEKSTYDVNKIFEKSSSEQPRIEIISRCQNSYGVISETIANFELQVNPYKKSNQMLQLLKELLGRN